MALDVFYTDVKTFNEYLKEASGKINIPVLQYRGRYGHLKVSDAITVFTAKNDELSAKITALSSVGQFIEIHFRVTHQIVK